jgi:hypothetical protein
VEGFILSVFKDWQGLSKNLAYFSLKIRFQGDKAKLGIARAYLLLEIDERKLNNGLHLKSSCFDLPNVRFTTCSNQSHCLKSVSTITSRCFADNGSS